MYSEFWSNKAPQASGNAGEMLRELVRIGFEQAVARAEASARMARNLAGCRTPLDAIAVYQDWMVNESQRVVADMRRMAELTRTLLQQSGEAALLNMPVEPAPEAKAPEKAEAGSQPKPEPKADPPKAAGTAAQASAEGQSAPQPKPETGGAAKPAGPDLPEAKPQPDAAAGEGGADKAAKKPARRKQATAAG
jgi:hypothetical protein